MKKLFYYFVFFSVVITLVNFECKSNFTTKVTIQGSQWYLNDQIVNKGSPAEGLLMNVRMVNSVFEDRGNFLPKKILNFDPDTNTDEFISMIPEYVSSGVNAFTISLQGGAPGYEGAVNTAFNADGSLRKEYFRRIEKVIRTCDAHCAVVNLSCFYQRQHSHYSALKGKEEITKALENVVNWITEKRFTNVLLEIANEYRHDGYKKWPDGDWLISEQGQIELIRTAKRLNPKLLVTTGGMGHGTFPEPLPQETDFLVIHFNNTTLENIPSKINKLKKYGKPIICNEDDKLKIEGAIAMSLSVSNGCGWGYMNYPVNQKAPFRFMGVADDTVVYKMFKNVSSPGFQIHEMPKASSIIITSPNDGDIFNVDENIEVRISNLYPDKSIGYSIQLFVNKQTVIDAGSSLQVNWRSDKSGTYSLQAVVKDVSGVELYRSAKVEIIIK